MPEAISGIKQLWDFFLDYFNTLILPIIAALVAAYIQA